MYKIIVLFSIFLICKVFVFILYEIPDIIHNAHEERERQRESKITYRA